MICKKCGEENIDGVNICAKCGNTLIDNDQKINKKKETKRKIVVILLTVALVTLIVCIFAYNILLIKYNIGTNNNYIEGDNNQTFYENTNETTNENTNENINENKRVGSSEYGYITVPNNWVNFIDLNGNDALQYSYANVYIATIYAIDIEQVDAYTYANGIMYNMENEGVQHLMGATVELGKYTAYQIYGYYSSDNTWLVVWIFEAEDKKTHFISIEGPDFGSEYFDIPNTFSLTK